MMFRRVCVIAVMLSGLVLPALAVQPDEILSDAVLEARARVLSKELRCMVCQNQSIDDSDAPLARDLRILVRDRLKAGDSDTQVLDFLVARYGEFVLLRPRFEWHTALLWLAPLARDLRVLVRERLSAGDSDGQVIDFLVARYGEFVLLKPRLSLHTLLLWGAPFAVLVIGGIAFFLAGRRRATSDGPASLTAAEEARINALLDKTNG